MIPVNGYQDCPSCQGRKKLKYTSGADSARCMNPSCEFSYVGLTDLILKLNPNKQYSDLTQCNYDPRAYMKRSEFLTKVFHYYVSLFEGSPAEDYIANRSLKLCPNHPIGYCPTDLDLSNYFYKQELSREKLLKPDGTNLLSNRVIFPITDNAGRIVHLQGRSLNPNAKVKWMSTCTTDWVKGIPNYLWNSPIKSKAAVLCEGIADGYTLLNLDINAVSCFGVNVPLGSMYKAFENCELLVVWMDGDTHPIGHPLEGQYKSWGPMYTHLCNLQCILPNLNIRLVDVESELDINDLYKEGILSRAYFQDVVKRSSSITKFYGVKYQNSPNLHAPLIQLASRVERLKPELLDSLGMDEKQFSYIKGVCQWYQRQTTTK